MLIQTRLQASNCCQLTTKFWLCRQQYGGQGWDRSMQSQGAAYQQNMARGRGGGAGNYQQRYDDRRDDRRDNRPPQVTIWQPSQV